MQTHKASQGKASHNSWRWIVPSFNIGAQKYIRIQSTLSFACRFKSLLTLCGSFLSTSHMPEVLQAFVDG